MGMNGLEVNYKLGREVAAEMSVVGFEAPVLNPQTRNERHEEDAGGSQYVMEMIPLEGILH
jgi:hypothetical protein